jgi:hypothetical protein
VPILDQEQKHVTGLVGNGKMFLHRGHINLDNDAIIKRCYDFLDEHNLEELVGEWGQLHGKLSTVLMSMYLLKNKLGHLMPHNWPELKALVDVLEQTSGENIKISWFNIFPPGTRLPEHTHENSARMGTRYGSVVYYPKLSQDDATLEIFSNGEWSPVNANTGDWLSFDLKCLHRVPVNNTNHHRISFTFDL